LGRALINALEERGMSVPGEMSILTYGLWSEAEKANPPLTTIELPMRLIGRAIPELVQRRLANPDSAPVSMQLETRLREGGSVAMLKPQ
jgi:DNA-binding LacI/PurR family transcriptional regulator